MSDALAAECHRRSAAHATWLAARECRVGGRAALIDDGDGIGLACGMDSHDVGEACNFNPPSGVSPVLFVSAFKD